MTSFALQLFGNYLPFISSPLKLFQVGWGRHTFSGFSRHIWLGSSPCCGWATQRHSQCCISHSCCVLRVIVLLEGKHSAQSEVLNTLDWVFIKAISIFWCIELFFYSDESLSPCCWKTAPQYEAATTTLYFWDGTLQVMSRAGSLQTWCLELRFIKPDNFVSQSLNIL